MSDRTGQRQRRPEFDIFEVCELRAAICRRILDDLPEWFGIPEAKAAYIARSESLPMFAARIDGEVVGFVSLKRHTDFAAEVYVTGVLRRFHRNGVGKALIGSAVQWAHCGDPVSVARDPRRHIVVCSPDPDVTPLWRS